MWQPWFFLALLCNLQDFLHIPHISRPPSWTTLAWMFQTSPNPSSGPIIWSKWLLLRCFGHLGGKCHLDIWLCLKDHFDKSLVCYCALVLFHRKSLVSRWHFQSPILNNIGIRVLHKIWRFMIILWDSSISKTVFGGPLWGSWGGWNPLGEPPEGVIFKVLLLIIRIPYFFEIWAKICQNLTKKNFKIFLLNKWANEPQIWGQFCQ